MERLRLIASILTMAIVLPGCASHNVATPLHVAFEDITSEVTTKSGPDLSYSSAVSLTGLSRVQRAGNQIFYPGDGLADAYSIGVAPKFSRLDVVHFPMEDNPLSAYRAGGSGDPNCPMPHSSDDKKFAKLVEVRNLYVCARDRLIDQAALELKLQVVQIGRKKIKDNSLGARSSVSALLFGSTRGEADDQAIDQAILELQGALSDKQSAASKASSALRLSVNTPNLLVTRWTTSRTNSQGLTIGKIFGGDRESQTRTSGVLILGDLRIVSLRFGEDFLASLVETEISNFERELAVVTTSLQSKYQLEIQDVDFSATLTARLGLTAEELTLLGLDPTALIRQQDLNISMALSELASIGNAVALANAKPAEYAFSFFPWDVYEDALRLECQRSQGFTTVYSVRVVGSDLVERVLKEARLDVDQMEKIRNGLGRDSPRDMVSSFTTHITAHKEKVRRGLNDCETTRTARETAAR